MADDCNAHTSILFDEVSLCDATQFQHMSVNMTKLLLTVDVQATLRARNNDVTIAAGQPRIFTSNPESFLDFVGQGMTETSDHFKAMRKRCFVGQLTSAVVSPAVARRCTDSAPPPIDMAASVADLNAMLR